MADKAKKLVVRFKVEIGDAVYRPGVYDLKGKEREALAKAPYVREQTEEEAKTEATALKKETAARKAKGVDTSKAPATDDTGSGDQGGDQGGNQGGGDNGDDIKLTEEELRELSREDLVAYYEKQTGKTAPANIGDDTMIKNLLK